MKEACLVIGRDDRILTLAVSLRRSHSDREDYEELVKDIIQSMRDIRPEHHLPDQLAILDELPRSYLVKVLHREVRERILDSDPDQKEKRYEYLYNTGS